LRKKDGKNKTVFQQKTTKNKTTKLFGFTEIRIVKHETRTSIVFKERERKRECVCEKNRERERERERD
jgi:hypothetical protein